MKEEIKLIVVLAQESRHIMETCRKKQRRISPTERDHVGVQVRVQIDAEGQDVLLKLYVISIAQVTSGGGIVSPGHCFNL